MLLLLRLIAHLPLGVLYAFGSVIHLLVFRVARLRVARVDDNLAKAFPERTAEERAALADRYRRNITDVAMEVLKGFAISPRALRERVRLEGLEHVRARLDAGQPVMLVAAHHCNWEWMLLALSIDLGYPLDAAYKPLVDPWADREMLILRTRFGARLVPAPELLGDVLRRNKVLRAIAMVGDQEPVTSDKKHWVRFLNRDSAFFVGGEEIVRKFKYGALFIRMKRVARGRYEMDFEPICEAGEALAPGEFTERYARLVEAQIHEAPADWPWNHKRWKLRKPLYGS